MADRPFKNLFEARDALNAEILAGKLQLSGPASAIFRLLVEHVLYEPDDEADVGFVVTSVPGTKDPATNKGKPMGVESIARLTGLGQTAVKTALKSLEEDDKLISRFTRPQVAGGRKVNRIRVDWTLPDRRVATDPTEEPGGDSSEGTPGDSSEQPGGDSSIRQEPLPQEQSKEQLTPGGARELLSGITQSQTQTPSVADAPSGEVSLGVIRETAARILGVKPGRLGHWPWSEIEDAVTKFGADAVLAEVTRIAGDSKRFGDDPVAHFRASVRHAGFYRLEFAPAAAQPAPEPDPEPEPGPSLPGTEEPDDTHVYPVIATASDGFHGRVQGQHPRFGQVGRYITQEHADNRNFMAQLRGVKPRAYAEHHAATRYATGRVLSWWETGEPHAERGRYWVQTSAE